MAQSVHKGAEVELEVGAVAESVDLFGRVKGRLQCKGGLHIYRSGSYEGVCKAADVVVDPGGQYDNQSRF